jgi:hypothetical protein
MQQYSKQFFTTRQLPSDWLACIQVVLEKPCLQALKYHRVTKQNALPLFYPNFQQSTKLFSAVIG